MARAALEPPSDGSNWAEVRVRFVLLRPGRPHDARTSPLSSNTGSAPSASTALPGSPRVDLDQQTAPQLRVAEHLLKERGPALIRPIPPYPVRSGPALGLWRLWPRTYPRASQARLGALGDQDAHAKSGIQASVVAFSLSGSRSPAKASSMMRRATLSATVSSRSER